MNKQEFIDKLQEVKKKNISLTEKQKTDIIERSIHSTSYKDHKRGETQLTIAIEEMAELTQQITKHLRGKTDETHLLEEFADVILGLLYIKQILFLPDEVIENACIVKLLRMKEATEEQEKKNEARKFLGR